MDIFKRRDEILQNNIVRFASNIRTYVTLEQNKTYIEMDIDVDLIKNIDYWRISNEQLSEHYTREMESDHFELVNMEVISTQNKKVARLRYMGRVKNADAIFRFTPSSNDRIFINDNSNIYTSTFGLTVGSDSINSIIAPADTAITTRTIY